MPPEKKPAMLSRREKWFAAGLLVLVIITGAGNLVSSYMQNRHFQQQFVMGQQQQDAARAKAQKAAAVAQAKANAAFQAQLCSIFLPIAALKAPAGDPATQPGRIYEQQLEAKLAQIAPALKCT